MEGGALLFKYYPYPVHASAAPPPIELGATRCRSSEMNYSLLLALLVVFRTASGRSFGPPVPAPCRDLRPGHPGSARTDPSPFQLQVSGLQQGGYVLGSTITGMAKIFFLSK